MMTASDRMADEMMRRVRVSYEDAVRLLDEAGGLLEEAVRLREEEIAEEEGES